MVWEHGKHQSKVDTDMIYFFLFSDVLPLKNILTCYFFLAIFNKNLVNCFTLGWILRNKI